MERIIHPKLAALLSALMVALTGNVGYGEVIMSKNINRTRPTVAPVLTTRSGSRYVRAIDVIRSVAGRREIAGQLQTKRSDSKVSTVTETRPRDKKQ